MGKLSLFDALSNILLSAREKEQDIYDEMARQSEPLSKYASKNKDIEVQIFNKQIDLDKFIRDNYDAYHKIDSKINKKAIGTVGAKKVIASAIAHIIKNDLMSESAEELTKIVKEICKAFSAGRHGKKHSSQLSNIYKLSISKKAQPTASKSASKQEDVPATRTVSIADIKSDQMMTKINAKMKRLEGRLMTEMEKLFAKALIVNAKKSDSFTPEDFQGMVVEADSKIRKANPSEMDSIAKQTLTSWSTMGASKQ